MQQCALVGFCFPIMGINVQCEVGADSMRVSFKILCTVAALLKRFACDSILVHPRVEPAQPRL